MNNHNEYETPVVF